MAALKEILPRVKSVAYDHSTDPWFKQRYSACASTEEEDLKADDDVIKTTTNPERMKYLSQDVKADNLIPKILKAEREHDDEKQKEMIQKTTQETKALVNMMLLLQSAHPQQPEQIHSHDSSKLFINYKPSQQFTSGSLIMAERTIRMVVMPLDPLDPPKFKHKRIPKPNRSQPPVPVMHSPPRPLTVKDQNDWKIPPCISDWKNPKGYTIPLDKRSRGLQQLQISDNFAHLSEALYVAEQQAREAVSMRSKVQKEMMLKEEARKEQELLALAQKARSETSINICGSEREERNKRDKIREERRRERDRERRLEAAKDAPATGKRRKIVRDLDRDISEKVALGMASAGCWPGGEPMYDQRLFNQEMGMGIGFVTDDDQYTVYDKALFTAQVQPTLYIPNKDEKVWKTHRFKSDKGFTGVVGCSRDGRRSVAEDADPFGLDQFITQVKGGKKLHA